MSLPAELTYVSCSLTVADVPEGSAVMAVFRAPYWLLGGADGMAVPAFTISETADSAGLIEVSLPATDDAAWSPQGWTYAVTLWVGTRRQEYSLAVPAATSGTLDLADVLNPVDTATPGVTYLLASARGAAGGVAALDADGDVNDAAGNKITGGEGGAVSWASITGKPSTFTPSLHASSHADGGADEISIDGSQVTSGTVAFARLPTGTSSSTVAVGNAVSTHVGLSDPHTQYMLEADTARVLVLETGDPVPGGTPAGTVIVRYTP